MLASSRIEGNGSRERTTIEEATESAGHGEDENVERTESVPSYYRWRVRKQICRPVVGNSVGLLQPAVSINGREYMSVRGQTTYDYLLGISLLLIAITAVFWLFPQVFDPFFDPVSSDQDKMADQLAAEVIETNATTTGERTLNVSTGTFTAKYLAELKDRSGVPDLRKVNLTLRRSGTIEASGGPSEPSGKPLASSVRTVRTTQAGNLDNCTTACDLVVRVW
ncbi:hypothetical protein HLRTI_002799 [Halorhabdus tiamatea SARL4B]|nr:hypothetical protein HLRTI_002799 [Halorhabdus tiamatea SARL4B]